MVPLHFVPLAAAGGLGSVLLLGKVSPRVEHVLVNVALATFGNYLSIRGDRPDRERLLQSAFIATPYRVYTAMTYLYSIFAAFIGSIVGVYLASALLITVPELVSSPVTQPLPLSPRVLSQLQSLPTLTSVELFSLLLLSSATVGLLCAVFTYQLRWILPELKADARRRRIELSLPRTIAFMYALSRGGMEIPRILRILERHQPIYGEAAREMAVAGRAINVFGMDTGSAIRHVSRRTPSDQFRIFTENLASVLESGRSIPEFFNEQYEQYQEEAEVQQEMFLERLAAIAEGYVALFVVGPLFLLTVLLIFGLISGGTQSAMEVIIYLLLPLLNVSFIYYLDISTQQIDSTSVDIEPTEERRDPTRLASAKGSQPTIVSDGGLDSGVSTHHHENLQRLLIFDRLRMVKAGISNPVETVRSNPGSVLYLAIPLSALWMLSGIGILLAQSSLTIENFDEYVVQSILIVSVPYATARYFHTSRLREIERVVPDMFNRLASLNESGIEIVNALGEIQHGDLGILTPELQRIWTDLEYGLIVEEALDRFESRTRVPSISRAVTLIRNGMKASGNIGPVLRIAADESRRLNALKRERESEMSIYLIIIYLSFIVFLAIIFVLVETFIPAIPARDALDGAGLTGAAAGITRQQAATFTMLLFHASLIQATFSGLIAGQMSQGSIKDGALHVVILVVMAYGLFTVIG